MRQLILMTVFAAASFANNTTPAPLNDEQIARKAVHEIRMYPRYTMWDNIHLQVRDGHLELSGQVSQPFKKNDLGRLVSRVPGVAGVTNNLEVLPLSPFDDQIRIQVARAIYRDAVLSRYALQSVPPIHIIVRNGQVTLEGVVSTEMEKNVATLRASHSFGLGPVQNNLRVENPKKKG